jgi:hypothetical protein
MGFVGLGNLAASRTFSFSGKHPAYAIQQATMIHVDDRSSLIMILQFIPLNTELLEPQKREAYLCDFDKFIAGVISTEYRDTNLY